MLIIVGAVIMLLCWMAVTTRAHEAGETRLRLAVERYAAACASPNPLDDCPALGNLMETLRQSQGPGR